MISKYVPYFFFQAEDGIRYDLVTGVQTCALPISPTHHRPSPLCHERVAVAPGTFPPGSRPWAHPEDHGTPRTVLYKPLLQIPCWFHPPLPAAPGAAVYPNRHAIPPVQVSFQTESVAPKSLPGRAPQKNRSKYIPRPAPLPAKFPGLNPLTCSLSLLILPIHRSVFLASIVPRQSTFSQPFLHPSI